MKAVLLITAFTLACPRLCFPSQVETTVTLAPLNYGNVSKEGVIGGEPATPIGTASAQGNYQEWRGFFSYDLSNLAAGAVIVGASLNYPVGSINDPLFEPTPSNSFTKKTLVLDIVGFGTLSAQISGAFNSGSQAERVGVFNAISLQGRPSGIAEFGLTPGFSGLSQSNGALPTWLSAPINGEGLAMLNAGIGNSSLAFGSLIVNLAGPPTEENVTTFAYGGGIGGHISYAKPSLVLTVSAASTPIPSSAWLFVPAIGFVAALLRKNGRNSDEF